MGESIGSPSAGVNGIQGFWQALRPLDCLIIQISQAQARGSANLNAFISGSPSICVDGSRLTCC